MDKALAKVLGSLCQVAYAQLTPIPLPLPSGAWIVETTLHVSEWLSVPFGLVAGVNGDLYVALRGTALAFEWVCIDANALLVPCIGGHCHAGFNAVANQLSPQIRAVVERFKPRNIYLTGHSLGASTAARLMLDFPSAICYEFCSPRWADVALAKTLVTREHYRFFSTEDAVPTAPYLPGTYIHTGTPIAVTFDGQTPAGNHSLQGMLSAIEGLP